MMARRKTNSSPVDKAALKYYLDIELSRRDFWYYCHVTAPDFYLNDREYLKVVCREMQSFDEDDTDVLILNLMPRGGKSRTAGKFVEWVFGKHRTAKVMTGSYNEILSTNFSTVVRDTISEQKTEKYRIVYSDIFPYTKIKRGDAAKNIWSLSESGTKNYIATSPTGTAIGFGTDYLIIDDIIKSAEEALNPAVLDKHWSWFTNTMYSRLEGRRKILIIMTQWATQDLAHRAFEHFTAIGLKVKQLCFNAQNEDGTMLDDRILPFKAFNALRKTLSTNIFEANYLNHAVDMIDALYGTFKTYKPEELPEVYDYVAAQTDTADEGGDFLCKIVGRRKGNFIYVVDILYTQERMEITEPKAAELAIKHKINYDRAESNNGGKGFARNVERLYREKGGTLTKFSWKATTANKEAKIRSHATGVNTVFIFPVDWAIRWASFYSAVALYSNTGKNEHDDAPDCLTEFYIAEFEKKKYGSVGGIRSV